MNIIEVKINRRTLPKDGQKIKWQTQDDFDNEVWKEGTFVSGDDIFCVGFEDTAKEWNCSWVVLHWEAI